MKKLTAIKFYSGHDPASGRDVQAKPGETIEVSDEKAKQLETDFPKCFEQFANKKKKASAKAD